MVTSGWRKDPLSKKPYDLLTEAAVIIAVCRLLMNARLRTENECRDSMYMGGRLFPRGARGDCSFWFIALLYPALGAVTSSLPFSRDRNHL